jgi:phosphohistidine phosphatase SixA
MLNLMIHRRRFCLILLILIGLLGVGTGLGQGSATVAPPATVYVIRHAEKLTDGRVDLSAKGFERAKVLANLFDTKGLAPPQVLFATHLSAHSNRPVETITPLAAALRLPINSEYMNEDYAGLAAELLSGRYAGKVVLVSWHHGKIPQLVTALGGKPPYAPWPEEQFDRIWRIEWVGGKAVVTDLPQGLLAGDSK